jgi:hypothetical protein
MFVSLSSCSSSPISGNLDSATPKPTKQPNGLFSPTTAQLRAKSANVESPDQKPPATNSQATASKTINVTLYTSDTQCQELIPQKAVVSAEEPMTGAIGKILAQRDTSDFNLSGYRVSVKNGVATVDLRISPESKRQLASLSSCEQFALFGSLRKTLTSNAEWKIKEVRFTERGQEILL